MSEDLTTPIIDLGVVKRGEINEFILTSFQEITKRLLGDIFQGKQPPPVKIKGTEREVSRFIQAIKQESSYMNKIKQNKLNDPDTYKKQEERKKAIAEFERTTGLVWPLD
jgi:hypothetical protein